MSSGHQGVPTNAGGDEDRSMGQNRRMDDLSRVPLAADTVGLLQGMATTRAIRRYLPEPVPDDVLRDVLFAATRAPSGSNRQPFRFFVLQHGEVAAEAKRLLAGVARSLWDWKSHNDGYDRGSGLADDSPKARMARTMADYCAHFETVPVVVLPVMIRYRAPASSEGGSIYPACQNLLLAARARGYGGVLTGFHHPVETQLKTLLGIPDEAFVAATISLGKPAGHHGSVRRRPLAELVFGDAWGAAPAWAQDPPGTRFTSAGPPRSASTERPFGPPA
jgi:nitroreductase